MTMTDPIADMLTRIRNANNIERTSVDIPYSRLKEGVAEALKRNRDIRTPEDLFEEVYRGETNR